ncbi:MAG TPA: DNA repair protein RecO [Clostridiales bacterium]|nr:DNA repair protein RecO [Clostridiales bacterium]
MALLTVRGFVIREVPVGETDRIIDILSSDLGLITASARGARRTQSRLLLATQVFSFSEFTLFANKGHYSVNVAEVIETFQGLHEDLERLVCAAHLAEVLLDCSRDDVAQPELYRLWAFCLHALHRQPDPLLLVHIAQLRLLAEIGFAPLLDRCVICGNPPNSAQTAIGFSIRQCGLVCSQPACRRQAGDTRTIAPGTAASLRHCLEAPLPRLFNCNLSDQVRQEFLQISDQYLTRQMEKEYTRLRLLNGLNGFGPLQANGERPQNTTEGQTDGTPPEEPGNSGEADQNS